MSTKPATAFQFNAVLNTEFLNELFQGDFQYALTVFESVEKELSLYWNELETGFDKQSVLEIKTAAHKCKTLFAYVGLTDMQQKLQKIENLCDEKKDIAEFAGDREELNRLRKAADIVISDEIKRLHLYYES